MYDIQRIYLINKDLGKITLEFMFTIVYNQNWKLGRFYAILSRLACELIALTIGTLLKVSNS